MSVVSIGRLDAQLAIIVSGIFLYSSKFTRNY
jgi:hypothetical protein